ncbi:MAG TPA: signal peptidase I [Candidatus Babeliales bacterium]|nr:signal peptidase I [Candidatus Babeliales bacterium]
MAYHSKKQSTGFWASVKEMAWLLLIVFLIRTFGFGLYQVPTGSMETTMLVGERFFADKFTYLFCDPQRGDIISMNDPVFEYSSNPIIRSYQEYVGWPIWPWGPANWTKRVIGVPGDHVKGVIEDGKPVVYLNGVKLDEPYLNKYPLLMMFNASGREEWRSYVPDKPFNDQPYYRVNERSIIHSYQLKRFNDEYLEFLVRNYTTITAHGLLLHEPQKPISAESGTRHVGKDGVSYWTDSDEFDVKLGTNQYWLLGDNRRGSHDCRYFGPIERRLIHGRILFRIWSIDSDESWWIVDLIKHPIDFWKRMRWSRFFQMVK